MGENLAATPVERNLACQQWIATSKQITKESRNHLDYGPCNLSPESKQPISTLLQDAVNLSSCAAGSTRSRSLSCSRHAPLSVGLWFRFTDEIQFDTLEATYTARARLYGTQHLSRSSCTRKNGQPTTVAAAHKSVTRHNLSIQKPDTTTDQPFRSCTGCTGTRHTTAKEVCNSLGVFRLRSNRLQGIMTPTASMDHLHHSA